jgi:hypothetical protein
MSARGKWAAVLYVLAAALFVAAFYYAISIEVGAGVKSGWFILGAGSVAVAAVILDPLFDGK